MPTDLTGAVLIAGGGITGIQSALDLANSGYYVYIVEKTPSIGGTMAQLDKTFPTNDCSMCILSPKLVEVGRHMNIEIITLAEIQEVRGSAGSFEVDVFQKARYVDMKKCIACGACVEKCPKKVDDAFNLNLVKRKAIYVPYPQAVPLKYTIDAANCLKLTKDKCGNCEKVCPAGAIQFDDQDKKRTLRVGAMILAPGFETFDPSGLDIYGYGTLPNVVTAIEFERILSASGPYEGHLKRPSDKTQPEKIAWLQCVGSRSIREDAKPYCSGVCCMYAIKEAVIAKEHSDRELDTAIFFMDMRTHGKDFEKTFERAKNESHVRFIRSRVHSIEAIQGSDDLKLMYIDDEGKVTSEIFNMVVLSVGMDISEGSQNLAAKLGVELNSDGFAETGCYTPVSTSRPGIYVSGVFSGPKDIPQSVMEASAAAAASSTLLSAARNTLTQKRSVPEEADITGQEPRIGVFVCHCGSNIGGVVDVPAVKEHAEKLPCVVFSTHSLFTCSQDSQENIKKAIKEHHLNRVVIASCSPRTHEALFQETIEEAGINPYLLEFTNIRDQNSWVHMHNPEAATRKAKDLVQMAVAKVALLEPLKRLQIQVNPGALIIGGGIAGMATALNLAEQGFHSYLVEKDDALGGNARKHSLKTWKGDMVADYLSDLTDKVNRNPNIEVLLSSNITAVDGFVGNFSTTVASGGNQQIIEHGAVVLATGGRASEPDEYLLGKSERVFKWRELTNLLEKDPERLEQTGTVAFIQCVGSREPDHPYCSKICCTASIRSAIFLKEKKPSMRIFILYRDIRTYGLREALYLKARDLGIIFIRYNRNEKPVVERDGEIGLLLTVTDHILKRSVQLRIDYLSLATAIVPDYQKDIAQMLKVPGNGEGFYMEAHMKLRPVDFATDGIYLCGLAHYPKPVEETIAQAQAAAARAACLLVKPFIDIEPIVSNVDAEKCIGCGLCESSCSFGAIRLKAIAGVGYRAENFSALCKGCGVCAAACPQQAIDMKHFSDRQLMAAIRAGIVAA
ncbi:MAG: CoB--CoM heterodisulfide reductase iron-sulfur subunit A family protein [Desulfobacteraceae bacterium]|nr:MAG: CoB--CoM heterodisulfide reductase iron-sulfur subunit A family protein [Desulfobacteraceae bacterium]